MHIYSATSMTSSACLSRNMAGRLSVRADRANAPPQSSHLPAATTAASLVLTLALHSCGSLRLTADLRQPPSPGGSRLKGLASGSEAVRAIRGLMQDAWLHRKTHTHTLSTGTALRVSSVKPLFHITQSPRPAPASGADGCLIATFLLASLLLVSPSRACEVLRLLR